LLLFSSNVNPAALPYSVCKSFKAARAAIADLHNWACENAGKNSSFAGFC